MGPHRILSCNGIQKRQHAQLGTKNTLNNKISKKEKEKEFGLCLVFLVFQVDRCDRYSYDQTNYSEDLYAFGDLFRVNFCNSPC